MALDATVGGPLSNSYETVSEAQSYMDTRLPIIEWDSANQEAMLIMGTRVLNAMASPHRVLRRDSCDCQYYLIARTWTGAPATTTQRLAWPRTGMFDRNGNAIPDNVIPQDLKDALSELAAQLSKADTTLDNDVSVQGIKSVSAGSVSVTFKDNIEAHVLPDAVLNLMPPSWFTDELIEYTNRAEFDVI